MKREAVMMISLVKPLYIIITLQWTFALIPLEK